MNCLISTSLMEIQQTMIEEFVLDLPQPWDDFWFAPSCAAITIFDQHRSDSCSMGFCHAVKQTHECLVRCSTMILLQTIWQWMWFLGLQLGDNFRSAPSCAAITIFDQHKRDRSSTVFDHVNTVLQCCIIQIVLNTKKRPIFIYLYCTLLYTTCGGIVLMHCLLCTVPPPYHESDVTQPMLWCLWWPSGLVKVGSIQDLTILLRAARVSINLL